MKYKETPTAFLYIKPATTVLCFKNLLNNFLLLFCSNWFSIYIECNCFLASFTATVIAFKMNPRSDIFRSKFNFYAL